MKLCVCTQCRFEYWDDTEDEDFDGLCTLCSEDNYIQTLMDRDKE